MSNLLKRLTELEQGRACAIQDGNHKLAAHWEHEILVLVIDQLPEIKAALSAAVADRLDAERWTTFIGMHAEEDRSGVIKSIDAARKGER